MQIQFYKYQSSGNNFILIDLISQDTNYYNLIEQLIKDPVVRKSDGILFISKSNENDFELSFYNPDGSESFCGNGSLCSLHYLKSNNKINDEALFSCQNHEYSAIINSEIKLKMQDITSYKYFGKDYFINTGDDCTIEQSQKSCLEKFSKLNGGKRRKKYAYYKNVQL